MKVSGLLIITENSKIDIKKIKGTIIVMMVDGRFLEDKGLGRAGGQFLHTHWWL